MSHPVLFTVAVILGIVSIVVGLSTGTAHNVCFGIMFFVAGRVLAHADDVNPENPLEEI
jgi:hypothetical protein